MKWLLILVACTVLVFAESDPEMDTVLQLLTDLKDNVGKEVEALDAAWERHQKNKLSVLEALGGSVAEQKGECYKKDQDVVSKRSDIQKTNAFIDWMRKRQQLNSNRISILEANRCQQNNNYIHDIKNYKIAITLVQFLKSQFDRLSSGKASLAQKQEFHSLVQKFMKAYHTGKLLTMVETFQNPDGSFMLPDIDIEQEDLTESVLTSTRGKHASFLQEDKESNADNAIVMIPGCDNEVQTIVVVQNDDGESDDGDLKIRFTNGGQQQQKPSVSPAKKHVDEDVDVESEIEEILDDHSEGEETVGEETVGEESEVVETEGEETEGEETVGEETEVVETEGEETEGEATEVEEPIAVEEPQEPSNVPVPPISSGGDEPSAKVEDDDDFPNTWEGFKKLLDAIEAHSKKSLDLGQEDEVRTAGTYIDFKIHIELENHTFDKHVDLEKENLIKLNNQLTNRLTSQRQCNARLKQISIAYEVALEDLESSKKHYIELKDQKLEEESVFEDVYRIYVNQVVN